MQTSVTTTGAPSVGFSGSVYCTGDCNRCSSCVTCVDSAFLLPYAETLTYCTPDLQINNRVDHKHATREMIQWLYNSKNELHETK